MAVVGRKRWAIAEGYIPSESSFSDPALVSHETACILNTAGRDAHVAITIFFADREPIGPFRVTIAARRALHLRFNDLADPQQIPRDTDYASVFRSEGYIPSESSFSDPALVSHETACILNTAGRDAHVAITIFFADREPIGPFRVTIAARRALHLRFNDLADPQQIPRDTDYASVFESDV